MSYIVSQILTNQHLGLTARLYISRMFSSGVTGFKPGKVRFIILHIHWRELRKNQYSCYITIEIDLSMKYKRDICFHYEIKSSMVTPTRKCDSVFRRVYIYF